MKIFLEKCPHGQDLPLPAFATRDSAGMDLYAAIDADVIIKPMERALVPAGFKMALPIGTQAEIRPRSGLAYKNGITVLNSPGTIDADYRGEVKILLVNLSHESFTVSRAMRIAQMVIMPYYNVICEETDNLDDTDRGQAGFGSTGIQ